MAEEGSSTTATQRLRVPVAELRGTSSCKHARVGNKSTKRCDFRMDASRVDSSGSAVHPPHGGPQITSPDRAALAMTADAQIDSPFFTLLPAEIRQLIYIEFWRNDGVGSLRQHITEREGRLTRVPCITDPLATDLRYTKFNNSDPGSDERSVWLHRLTTNWTLHWACEEAHLSRHAAPRSSFLPVLLSCKRMQVGPICEAERP